MRFAWQPRRGDPGPRPRESECRRQRNSDGNNDKQPASQLRWGMRLRSQRRSSRALSGCSRHLKALSRSEHVGCLAAPARQPRANMSCFVVVRDERGYLRVLFNRCLHRGMQVCRSELGNASHFRCPYHAWPSKVFPFFHARGRRGWVVTAFGCRRACSTRAALLRYAS
jgi:hypothetical protein